MGSGVWGWCFTMDYEDRQRRTKVGQKATKGKLDWAVVEESSNKNRIIGRIAL